MNLKTNWRDEALAKLQSRSRLLTYEMISEGTGLKVGWLKHFAGGHIPDPGVNSINSLIDFLNSWTAQ